MGLGARDNTVHVGIAAWPWGSYLVKVGLTRGICVKTSSLSRHHVNVSMVRAKASESLQIIFFATVSGRSQQYARWLTAVAPQ